MFPSRAQPLRVGGTHGHRASVVFCCVNAEHVGSILDQCDVEDEFSDTRDGILPSWNSRRRTRQFHRAENCNRPPTHANHPPLLPIAEDAAYAFAGGADVASDFLMGHVQCDAQTVGGNLAVLVCPFDKELSELGVRIRGQRQHARLLPGFADFHTEMLGHTQRDIRVSTHQLKKCQPGEEAHLARAQCFSRGRVRSIRNQRAKTEYFAWLCDPQREALALLGIHIELRLACADEEKPASRLPLNKQQCPFGVKSSLTEIIELGQRSVGKLTE